MGVDAQLDIQPGQQGCAAAAGSTCLRQVLLLGNPVVWWFGRSRPRVGGASRGSRERDWRYGLVTVGIAATWLPWLRYDDRPIFSYYAVVILPFLVLGRDDAARGDARAAPTPQRCAGRSARPSAGSVVVLTMLAFAWFWPIWTDQLITNREWVQRMWFRRWI